MVDEIRALGKRNLAIVFLRQLLIRLWISYYVLTSAEKTNVQEEVLSFSYLDNV